MVFSRAERKEITIFEYRYKTTYVIRHYDSATTHKSLNEKLPGIKQRKTIFLRYQKVQQVRQSLFDSKIRSRWICTVTVRVWLWLRSADELAQPSSHVSRDTVSAY